MNNEIDRESRVRITLIAILYALVFMAWMCSHDANAGQDPNAVMVKDNECKHIDPAFLKLHELYYSKPYILYDHEEKKKLEKYIDDHPELKVNLA